MTTTPPLETQRTIREVTQRNMEKGSAEKLQSQLAALREQLIEEQSRNQLQADSLMHLESRLSQVEQERDRLRDNMERLGRARARELVRRNNESG